MPPTFVLSQDQTLHRVFYFALSFPRVHELEEA
jgi:hypothetical protein